MVHFHVLASEDFKLDAKKRQLALKGSCFNAWQEDKLFPRQDNGCEFVLSIPVARHLVTSGRFSYKYMVIEKGGTPEYEFEHYKVGNKTGPSANRTLDIPLKWKNKDEWHQYDGCIERQPTVLSKLYNKYISNNELIKHVKNYVEVHSLKIWQKMRDDCAIQEGQDELMGLYTCMQKVYYVDHKYWNDENDFRKEIGNSLIETALVLLKQGQGDKDVESVVKSERQTVIALAIVHAVGSLKVDLPVTDAMHLCEALTMKSNTENGECPELKLATKYFKRKELTEALIFLAKGMVKKSKNPSWLFLVPLIHFLSDAVKPYQPIEVDMSHEKPVWWGISHLGEDIVKKFKEHSGQWDIDLESMIHQLSPLFDMDVLLPRTLMAIVELKFYDRAVKTNTIPMEICIANLIFQIRTNKPRYFNQAYETTDEKVARACAVSLMEQLQGFVISDQENKTRWEMCIRLMETLMTESMNTKRNETVNFCTQIAICCTAIYDKVVEKSDTTEKINMLSHKILHWFTGMRWESAYIEGNLQLLNGILAAEQLQSDRVRDVWNDKIKDGLMTTLNREIGKDHWKTSNLIRLYCEKTDMFHPVVQECLGTVAFKTISNGYTIDYGELNKDGVKRFGNLLSNMFNTEWNKTVENRGNQTNSENDNILRHVLHWKPFLHFLKIRDKDQDKLRLFQGECLERMVKAVSVIELVVKMLLDGSITIDTLNLIGVQENRFDEIAEHVMQEKKQKKDFFSKAITVRKMEIAAFHKQADHMTTLTSLCEHLRNVDRKAVDQTLDKQKNIGKHCLKEFVKPAQIASVVDVATFTPSLCAFEVKPPVLVILPELHHCNQSNTFLHLWQQAGRGVGDEPLTLEDVVVKVWQPVKRSWNSLAKQIQSGEITFQQVEQLIGRIYREDYEHMRQELEHMDVSREVVTERLYQLEQYRHLYTCVKGAKVILDFAKKYQLKGNFDDIKTIALHGQKDLQMKFFDKSLMKTCHILKGLTPDRAKCLDQFVQCTPLVKWLKESMSSTGLKELKVFVDLAFMSAGEEPINVKRVQCLHSAVTGYGPLIFDLKPEDDYKELLRKCDLVWVELKANPALPKQLMDTNRQLEWLKDVKKAHGSVEVTSLVQADAINTCGVYTVGKRSWKNDPNLEKMEGLMQVLQLKVSEVEGKRQIRNYNFSQLQDLQSRLMLVASKAEKGSEGVENFTMVFDSIVRLSKVYLQLCSAGCVLFQGWTARFLCDARRPVCMVLEFGDTEDTPHLKGRRNNRVDLKEMIPQLANFMERCYEDWLRYIKEKRSEYLHLNFFTVDQLVILQRELVKYGMEDGTDDGPSHLVYPLLSAVKQDCTPADLVHAMAAARDSLQQTEMEQEAEATEMDEQVVEMTEEDKDADLRETFIEEIIGAGYDRALAVQALEHVSADDVDEGIIWCMNHIEDEEMSANGEDVDLEVGEGAQASAEAAKPAFAGWNSESNSSIQNLIASNVRNIARAQSGDGFEPLLEDLELLWSEFLGSLTSNVKDYLSLEHLGLILTFLAKANRFSVNRSLPPGYQEDAPNLLVCPSDGIHYISSLVSDVKASTCSSETPANKLPQASSSNKESCTRGKSVLGRRGQKHSRQEVLMDFQIQYFKGEVDKQGLEKELLEIKLRLLKKAEAKLDEMAASDLLRFISEH